MERHSKFRWIYRVGIIIGLVLICISVYDYYKQAKEVGVSLELGSITESSDIEEPIIEVLTGDQNLEEVKEEKNCIMIPSIGVKAVIHEGVSRDSIATGVGHYSNTKKIGEDGNACYTGHYSTKFNCVFNKLPDADMYSEVWGFNSKGTKTVYYITDMYITEPENLGVLNNTSDKRLTLITCANNGTKRLIVTCSYFTKEELQAYKEKAEAERESEIDSVLNELGTTTICKYVKHRGRILHVNYPKFGINKRGADNSIVNSLLGKVGKSDDIKSV